MKKKLLLIFVGLLAVVLVVPSIAAQPDAPVGPIRMQRTNMPVVFNHATHQTQECVACHHLVANIANFQSCATTNCHHIMGQRNRTVNSYYRIFHERRTEAIHSCISCHYEVAGQNSSLRDSLTSCTACHS